MLNTITGRQQRIKSLFFSMTLGYEAVTLIC